MDLIESIFKLKDHKTSFKKEILAGLATFLTMAYIMVVNPAILSETGMDFDSVFVATILASFVACLLMGFLANWPVALAPGMGLNAFFTYAVVFGMGFTWQQALAAVLCSGILLRAFHTIQAGILDLTCNMSAFISSIHLAKGLTCLNVNIFFL